MMDKITNIDKNKERFRQLLIDIANDIDNISDFILLYEKDDDFYMVTQNGVDDNKLLYIKSHLEQFITMRMIKANFVTPE
jgi:hypothetical protein